MPMEGAGEPPRRSPDAAAGDARSGPAGADGTMVPRGTSYGRAGARWMVDPEAIWRPGAARGRDEIGFAVVITRGSTRDHGPHIVQADNGFGRMTGFGPDAARGLGLDLLAGSDAARARLGLAFERLAEGRSDAGVAVCHRRDGAPFGLAWTVEPLRPDDDDPAHGVWVFHEIGIDRAEADGDAAAPPPAALLVATTGAGDATGGRILCVNEAFAELTEYPAAELAGADPALLRGTGTPEGESRRLERALEGRHPCRVELVSYTRSARPFWNAMDVLPFARTDGRDDCWLGLARDVTERRDREQRVYEAAYYDDLTGLPNRALAQARIERAIRLAHRNRGRVGLVYVDLERFDALRPHHSRPALNDLLSRIATRFADATRSSDTLAYVGADEFVVVAEDIGSPEEACDIAERLCEVAAAPIRIGERSEHVGATVGISVYPDHGSDTEQLLQRADAALIQARADGDAWGLYSPERMGARLDRLFVEDELRAAIGRDEFAVALQPIVSLADEGVVAYEALARWHHPEEGWIAPADFLPRAAERGLLPLVGARVQTVAFDALATWRTVLPAPAPRIVLNAGLDELADRDYLEGLGRRLDAAGLPWDAVELDLRPGVLRAADADTIVILRDLRERGVTLALDDAACPEDVAPALDVIGLDRLKLDIALVRDLPREPSRQALARDLLQLAREHELAVLAEGVETAEELEYLARIGCTSAQGHFFGRPEIV